jgi:asparagine synthase (glutamine-hydrolysing)
LSGICGIVNLNGVPPEPHALKIMAHAAAHRGPHGIRFYQHGPAALAHLSLNLSPEDERQDQPLLHSESGLLVVADARIDNREQLALSLKLSEPTDAELILAAYLRWGEQCASRLIGDFAFVVWDSRRRRLFAARDPMGMRALYYRLEEGRRLLFGSEAAQILAVPGVEPCLFEPAVGAYLVGCFGPLEWSFYEGISQLVPAHALVVDERGWRTWRYWEVEPDRRIRYRDEEEYTEHFLEVFSEAVRCRLRSTRAVGLFLSGGVDSGSIASVAGWLMAQEEEAAPGGFRAYSWAFEELAQCDERHISSIIAGYYGFPVTEVCADDAWPLSGYPDHTPHRDEPYIGVYQPLIEHTLSAARSEGMGYVLSGDRGDLLVGDALFDHLGLLRSGRLRTLREELREQSCRSGAPVSTVVRRHLLRPLLLNLWPQGRLDRLREPVRRMLGSSQPSESYPDWVRLEFARRIGLDEIVRQNENPPSPAINDSIRRTRYELIFTLMHMRGMVGSSAQESPSAWPAEPCEASCPRRPAGVPRRSSLTPCTGARSKNGPGRRCWIS